MSTEPAITIATAKLLLDRDYQVLHFSDAHKLLAGTPVARGVALRDAWPGFAPWLDQYQNGPSPSNNFSDCVPGTLASLTHLGEQGELLHIWRQLDVLKSSLTLLQFNALVFDREGHLVFMNQAAEHFLHTQRVEDWLPLLPDEWHDDFTSWLGNSAPIEFEKEFNGQFLRWEISSDPSEQYLVMVCHPMLDRENYRRILEYSVDGIYQTSRQGELVYANQSLARLFGYSNPSEMKQHIRQVEHDIYRYSEDRLRFVAQLREQGEVTGFECEMFDKDGHSVWIRQNARAIFDEHGEMEYIIGTVANMSDYKRSEMARMKAEKQYQRLFNTAQAGLYQSQSGTDMIEGGLLLRVNQMFAHMLGYYSPEHCIEQVTDIARDVYAEPDHRWAVLNQLRSQGLVTNERVLFKRWDGSQIWVMLNAQVVETGDDGTSIIEGSIYDITHLVKAENEIRFLAEHDPLTRLPNRSRFQQQLQAFYDHWRTWSGHEFVVVFLDLDHFKDINDTLGHLVGDSLLQEVARRLQQPLNVSYETFRLGGDEFGILIDGAVSDTELDVLCRQIIDRISREYRYMDNILRVTASLGVVRSSQLALIDATSVLEEIMSAADLALYSCKRAGRAGYQLYQEPMKTQLLAEKDLEQKLEAALRENQLQLYFQPIFNTATGRVTGAEALIRWPTDEGMVSPATFIPLAERCGLIADIDAWVIRKVVHYLRLLANTHPDINLSFNLSAHHFNYDSFDQLFEPLADQIQRWGSRMTVELTERVMFEHTDKVLDSLNLLRRFGVSISLDDFGTGYSSLSYLTQFPISKIKIDQGFIQNMDTDATARAVVQAATQIGKTLKLQVNAEGVETQQQADYVRELGIDEAQGYHLARPMPMSELLQLLTSKPAPGTRR
ncbi:MAG: sensor domain-containing protein [Saccharospirillum sp.]